LVDALELTAAPRTIFALRLCLENGNNRRCQLRRRSFPNIGRSIAEEKRWLQRTIAAEFCIRDLRGGYR
jgi:hypothetical protein